ncbi:polysaccharide biosynthesis C-terminal domain-containing protein [Chryseobacterium sp.]|uniref:lipopolysaccharide biosynthesis protein n=1 Tax=Chryseobacterium sp. TaxID=1871047 RepID=UPI0028A19D7F|nr:polysaccharide biosynthesis C-terminal domain-containing protein [Chryseobacterium sp.]
MIKNILQNTLVFGFSTVIIKLFPFIISPFISQRFGPNAIAPFVDFYSVAGIIIVLLTHGMETSFFRFAQNNINSRKLISTASLSVILASLIFIIISLFFKHSLADAFKVSNQISFLVIMLIILGVDGVCAMPFVILRKEGKSKRYAFVKTINAIVNFLFVIFFIVIFPMFENGILGFQYNKSFGIGYVFVANLIASILTLILLFGELKKIKITNFDFTLWKKLLIYSWPIMIAGLSGVINETMDRQFLKYLLPDGENIAQMSIYGTVCKLVTFITLFRQAYLLGVEPFFFSYAKNENSGKTYSRLMTVFIIVNCIIFLGLCVNLNWISELYIRNADYYVGLPIVPIVLIAAVFLGIYLNLSIWYKLSDKTRFGAYISVVGAIVTIVINYFFIPNYGYWASAWATLASYFIMMVISYFLGQKYYPIPYEIKTCIIYIGVGIAFAFVSYYLLKGNIIYGNILFLIYLLLIFFERKLFIIAKQYLKK